VDVDAADVLPTSVEGLLLPPTVGSTALDMDDAFQYLDHWVPRLGALHDNGGLARDCLLTMPAPTTHTDGEVRELLQAVRQRTGAVQTMYAQQAQQGKMLEDLCIMLRATPSVPAARRQHWSYGRPVARARCDDSLSVHADSDARACTCRACSAGCG
jgi:hypothetical protein